VKASARQSWFGDLILWVGMIVCGLMVGGLSVARYLGYNAGMFDLGNMAQAIWSATQGQPLLFTAPFGSMSRLTGHVELIYFLLAPLYGLWPDPRLLLAIQAALFALGALPVYRLALRRTGDRFAARCLAFVYLLYPTALTSVLFDFHSDTLALPLLLFALDALDERAWRRYALFMALALSCKFYVAAPVALVGVYAFVWGGQRRAGALTIAAALLYGLVAFFVVRPLFAPSMAADVASVSRGYLDYYFGRMAEIRDTLGDRFLSAVVVFGPALLVARHGWRWLLPGLPIAIAALLTTGPGGAYDYRYHHYAVVVPFIMMAAIEGVARMRAADAAPRGSGLGVASVRRRRSWRGDLGLTMAIVAIFTALLVDTPLNPLFWLGLPGQGRDPSAYGILPRDAVKERFLEAVPPGATLAASNQLAPHLADRSTLYLLRYPDESEGPRRLPQNLARVDYALADALFDLYLPAEGGYGGGLDGDRAAIGLLLRDPDFGLVAERDGLLLFQRAAPPERALTNTLALLPDDGAPAEQSFGAQIALVRHTIAQSGPRRLRATFAWRLTGSFPQSGRFVAVSRLDGVAEARMVHLPTYALLPPWEWRAGQLIVETFDVDLPADLAAGRYAWRLGWYNVGLPASYATDARSLLPGSQEAMVDGVDIK
jgi:uncharacterized membrane protein